MKICLPFPAGIKLQCPALQAIHRLEATHTSLPWLKNWLVLRLPKGNYVSSTRRQGGNLTPLTLRNSFGELDDAGTCHIG